MSDSVMSDSASPPAKPTTLRPMFLPPEIFLLLVETIIDDAEAQAFDQPMTWWLHAFAKHETEQFTIFSVEDIPYKFGGEPKYASRNLTDTLRISEVNGRAFRMVRRRFSRLPYWFPFGRSLLVTSQVSYAWTHPTIDFFHPMIDIMGLRVIRSPIGIEQTVRDRLMRQSPRGAQTTAHIRNVVFAPVLRQGEDMELHSRALQAMPNLKVLHLGMRMAVESLPEKFCEPGAVIPVDAPEVRKIRYYLEEYEAFWMPFMERGVRVVLDGQTFESGKARYLLDLFREEDGLYMRHVDPRSHWFKLRSPLEIPV